MKYTKAKLAKAVRASNSYAGVLRFFGLRQTGGSQSNIRRWIGIYKLDTAHFLGQGSNRGVQHTGGPDKKTWQQVLILRKNGDRRQQAFRLRRALIEAGVPYKCNECDSKPRWNGKELRLQVEHINRNFVDDRKENLKFLCPNCHSQTEGHSGSKNKTGVTSLSKHQ
jgi:uncharacterized protein YlaI